MNIYDIALDVLCKCVNEKKEFSLIIKDYSKQLKITDKKNVMAICGIVLRNYYLIKYFSIHVLKFVDLKLSLATGIVFGTVAFKKVEHVESCKEWYKALLEKENVEFSAEMEAEINTLIEKKKNYYFKDLNKGSIQYFSINNNLPTWFLKMLYSQYGKETMYKVGREYSKMPKQFVFKPEFIELTEDEKVAFLDFDEVKDNIYIYKKEKSIKSVLPCHSNSIFPIQYAEHILVNKLPLKENKEICIVLHSSENTYAELIAKYVKTNKVNILYSNAKKYLVPLTKIEKALNSQNLKFYETSGLTLEAYTPLKQDLVVYFAQSSNLDMLRRIPDYMLNFSENSITELTQTQLNELNELAKYVEAGGSLVYAVPTINIKETEVQIVKFLENNKNFNKEYCELFFPNEKDNSTYYFAILKKVR